LTRGYVNTQVKWEIGEHGMSGKNGFWKPYNNQNISLTITADSDFRILSKISTQTPMTINTTGTDNQPHEIEITGGICGSGNNSGTVTITGAGRVVADYDVNDLNLTAVPKANAFNVNGTATLAVKPGSNLGTGAITVANGAKFEVASSGTVTLTGNLSLADGTALGFNFTDHRTTPVLACAHAPTFVEGEATNITVKVSGDVRPSKGEKILTTCGGFDAEGVTVALAADVPNWVGGLSVNGDGNIVLDVKSVGMVIKVK
jgi:hypothetical protein